MEVLVTGANGFVGHHLAAALSARGDTVRALVLPSEDATWLGEHGVIAYRGDIRDPDTLAEPMRGVDIVFHLAAVHGLWRPRHEYHTINVLGVENVCRAAAIAGVRRLVHVSSWTVYGMGFSDPVGEDHPLQPIPDPYTLTKVEGERRLRAFIARDHLPAVIVRPGTMFGPGDRVNFGRMVERLRRGRVAVIGAGSNALPFVYVSDVVRGMILAAEAEGAQGQTYNLSNDEPLTQEEMWRVIAAEIGVRPRLFHVPYRPLYALGFIAEHAASLSRSQRQPLVTRLGLQLFGTNNRHAIDKARSELGYRPQVSIREGIRLAARWHQQVAESAMHANRLPARA